MNADHADALIQLARMFAGMESTQASMTSIDRLGFHVRLKTKDGMRGARIAFSRGVSNPLEARNVLVEMTAQARQKRRFEAGQGTLPEPLRGGAACP